MVWAPLVASMVMAAAKAKQDADRERDERNTQVETTRNSPWTGMKAQAPTPSNTAGTMASGLASGMAMSESKRQGDAYDAYLKSLSAGPKGPTMSTPQVAPPPQQGPMSSAVPRMGADMSMDDYLKMQEMRAQGYGSAWPSMGRTSSY
jgi:hypothetical protein